MKAYSDNTNKRLTQLFIRFALVVMAITTMFTVGCNLNSALDGQNSPGAAFSYSPDSIKTDETVTFTDMSTNNPTSWSWNFGDGSESTDKNPTHAYSATGTYTVSLTVENANGSSTTQQSITIEDRKSVV
jgi:PKD repeat protein